jgi:Carboxypeptidase regulatory-like domain
VSSFIVSAAPSHADVPIGESVTFALTIRNTSQLIDGYDIRVFGLDPAWVNVPSRPLSLFPDVAETVEVVIQLPVGFTAGVRQLSLYVRSLNDAANFEICPLTINVARQPRIGFNVDPNSVTGAKRAQFGLVVQNQGNAPIDVTPSAVDPEEAAAFEFSPQGLHVPPGERAVFQAKVTAPRPWFGQPVVRVLTFGAATPDKTEAIATFIQKPRISRWVLSMLGLITAAAIFAAVLSHTFGNVVDKAKVSDAVVNKALEDQAANNGAKVSVTPANVTGKVVSATTSNGIGGVQAQLFSAADGTIALSSAATADNGTFAFGHLSAGKYRVKFAGAGFAPLWYKTGKVFADAEDVEVTANVDVKLDDTKLAGQPATVKGKVIGPDLTGTTATLVVPGLADLNTKAVVAKTDVSADGSFRIENVPSPATYELVVQHPGSTVETRVVDLAPGATTDDIIVRLGAGDGIIQGTIFNGATPLGGVTVEVTDGTIKQSTVSLTVGQIGFYALRNLPTPGLYTVTVTAPNFAVQSRTISLDAPNQGVPTTDPTVSTPPVLPSSNFILIPSTGSIAGAVTASTGEQLGSVTVTVTGGPSPIVTSTISQGTAAGTWKVGSLAVPGSYTVTFSKAGYVSQTRQVQLSAGAGGGTVPSVNAALVATNATVQGTVFNAANAKVGQATVTLSNGTVTRSLLSADSPIGSYAFGNVAAGSYTITAELPGTVRVVQVVTVHAGDTRDVPLTLGQQASLSGSVLHASGAPQVGISVRLYLPTDFPGGPSVAVARTTTAPDGSFSFTGIRAPENYIVAIYPSTTAVDALDSQQIASVPGQAVPVPTFTFG